MKLTKRVLLSLAMAVLLIAMSAFAIFASEEQASEVEPSVAIKSFALNLGDAVHIKVTALGTDLPENTPLQILVWNAPQSEYTHNSAVAPDVVNPYGIDGNGRTVFYYTKVSAKEMADNFYFVACARYNGEYVYSPVQKYSVLQYAYPKTVSNSTATDLKLVLSTLLQYGGAAQVYFKYNTDRLASDTFYQLTVANGKLSDGQKKGLYLATDTETITADEPQLGYGFEGWQNSAGVIVSTSPVYTISNMSKDETYTAVYTEYERLEPTDLEYFEFVSLANGAYAVKAKAGVTLPADLVIPAYYNNKPVTVIDEFGFASHSEIRTVKFENNYSLTEIKLNAFSNCHNIVSFTIPATVRKVADSAFNNCYKLVEVYNLSTMSVSAGNSTVGGVAKQALVVHNSSAQKSNLTFAENGLVYYSSGTTSAVVAYFGSAAAVTLPSTINGNNFKINKYAFYANTTINKLVISNGVVEICDNAFMNATALRSIAVGNNAKLAKIGASAFKGCSDLAAIYIPNTVVEISANAFDNCAVLTIFTSYESAPSTWSASWNPDKCPVEWNYTPTATDTPIVPVS